MNIMDHLNNVYNLSRKAPVDADIHLTSFNSAKVVEAFIKEFTPKEPEITSPPADDSEDET